MYRLLNMTVHLVHHYNYTCCAWRGDGGGGQITVTQFCCSNTKLSHDAPLMHDAHFSPDLFGGGDNDDCLVMEEEEEDGSMLSLVCCAVRHCHMLFHHTHILYSPVADVFGGRDDTSWGVCDLSWATSEHHALVSGCTQTHIITLTTCGPQLATEVLHWTVLL